MQCTVRVALIGLSVLMACSPEAPEDSTDGAASASTGTGATPTTGAASTSTGGGPSATSSGTDTGEPTTTGEPPTTDATSDASTMEATSGPASATTGSETTAGTTSAGADETTAAVEPVTRAWWVDGNELQIRVIQEDPVAGLCRGLLLGLEQFVSDKYDTVAAPPMWGVQVIFVHAGPGACLDPYQWYENGPAFPGEAEGTVVFHDLDDKGKPATLDIEVTATYAPGEPWTPTSDMLVGTAVTVEVG